MKKSLFAVFLFALVQCAAQADDGLVSVKSENDVSTTADRFVTALEAKGLAAFSRINHAAAAEKIGMSLTPTELVIFGAPKVGTALMHCGHSIAIDLPLKALAWEDAEGQVWLTYNDPAYLAARHKLEGCEKVLAKVEKTLSGLAEAATK